MNTDKIIAKLLEFIEMLESDKEAIQKGHKHLPTHKIIGNYIEDLNEIIYQVESEVQNE